jgi:hypothetical protein
MREPEAAQETPPHLLFVFFPPFRSKYLNQQFLLPPDMFLLVLLLLQCLTVVVAFLLHPPLPAILQNPPNKHLLRCCSFQIQILPENNSHRFMIHNHMNPQSHSCLKDNPHPEAPNPERKKHSMLDHATTTTPTLGRRRNPWTASASKLCSNCQNQKQTDPHKTDRHTDCLQRKTFDCQ